MYCNGNFLPLICKFCHLLKFDTIQHTLPTLLNTQKDKNLIFGQRENNITPQEALKIHMLAAELRDHYRLSTLGFDVLRNGDDFRVVDVNYFPGPTPGDNFVEFVKQAIHR